MRKEKGGFQHSKLMLDFLLTTTNRLISLWKNYQ